MGIFPYPPLFFIRERMIWEMTKFQHTIESLLKKFNKLSHFKNSNEFYLKLENGSYMDLVIERQGDTVMVGHYCIQNGDLISDPVLVFIVQDSGNWFPFRIEQVFGDTEVARYQEDGRITWHKTRYENFISFAALFARNIVQQGWDRAQIKSFSC